MATGSHTLARLSVGTSGWSYPSWRPGFYPAGLDPSEFLRFYAERFQTVELNTTGYRLPAEDQFRRWAEQVPDGFEFSPKLPGGRLSHLQVFESRLRMLGDRLAASGGFVLVYPGANGPVPSARLEQIRNGIEDWEIFDAVRQKHGVGAVRSILGDAGLFSAGAGGVRLGCTVGCALETSTPFSWPQWSQGAAAPSQIERARVRALTSAS